MKKAIVYTTTFVKKDGSERRMKYVRLSELGETDYETYGIPVPTLKAPTRKYAENHELVWDIEANNFRILNWATVID